LQTAAADVTVGGPKFATNAKRHFRPGKGFVGTQRNRLRPVFLPDIAGVCAKRRFLITAPSRLSASGVRREKAALSIGADCALSKEARIEGSPPILRQSTPSKAGPEPFHTSG